MSNLERIRAVLEEYKAPHISSISVRMSRGGPGYAATSGTVTKHVGATQQHCTPLLQLGATNGGVGVYGAPQVIQLPEIPAGEVRALTCAGCHCWMWVDGDASSGNCRCGQTFRVEFGVGTDEGMPDEERCRSCGTGKSETTQPVAWKRVRARNQSTVCQSECGVCHHGIAPQAVAREPSGDGG